MTYLSAKKEGFTGSFNDWVDQDRPNTAYEIFGGSAKAQREYESEIRQQGLIKELGATDLINLMTTREGKNQVKWTLDEASRELRNVGRTSSRGHELTPSYLAGLVTQHMNQDMFKMTYGGYQSPEHEKDWDVLSSVLPSYVSAIFDPENKDIHVRNAATSLNSLLPDAGFGDTIKAYEEQDKAENEDKMQDAQSMSYTGFKRIYPESSQEQYSQLKEQGINGREVDTTRPGEGTISEQNKTGVPYPTWAAQQQSQGKPSSYQDWLSAKPTTGGQAGANANATTTPTGQNGEQAGASVGADDNTTLALQQLDAAVASGLLNQDTASLFKTVVRNWDVNKELNMDNVLKEFDTISESTISPYFAEQADIFKKDVQTAYGNLEQSRSEELEAQGIQAGERIEGTQEDLARRGLTFSSEGAKQLGTESAFGGKVPFGGEKPVGEGLVPTQNRLISSGSQRSYQQAIDTLGRQAENTLGQNNLVQGFTPRGVSQGTIDQNKQTAEANVLSGLAGQQRQNFDYQKPLNFNF